MTWKTLMVWDSAPDYASCEFCGKEKIRWCHQLQNTKTGEIKVFGCDCADKVTGMTTNSDLEKFLKLKWKDTSRGLKKTYKENDFFIFYKDGIYINKINGFWGSVGHKDIISAKMALFFKLKSMKYI